MPNRLANETSPYLLQHADNPVDWYPWGPEALERARAENKPILLSIGYAACHWCHVMAHESFEDDATAALMNERFVNIKVDREERPDLDAIYMQAVQAMTGHGGWPMTVFLTPDGVPFYGGTYFPPEDRHGMPSFTRILTAVSDAYRDEARRRRAHGRDACARCTTSRRSTTRSAGPLTRDAARPRVSRAAPSVTTSDTAASRARRSFRRRCRSTFCCATGRARGVENALAIVDAARSCRWRAAGSTIRSAAASRATPSTRVWLVPHFEKMLYDNALLVRLGAHLWQATDDAEVRRVVERDDRLGRCARCASPDGRLLLVARRRQRGPRGQVLRLDAAEIDALLGDDAPVARAYWGVTDDGNFEGKNILSVVDATGARSPRAYSDRRSSSSTSRSRARDGDALRRASEARLAGARRQDARVVERAHGARHRRGGARVRQRRRTGALAVDERRRSCSTRWCATGACCARTRTAARASPAISRTTPRSASRRSPSTS